MFEFLLEPIYLTWIVEGFLLTVEITLFGVLLGLGLGTLLAIGDIYGNKPIKAEIGRASCRERV
jgi:ABC-type amino acid transport system permease subunit